MRESLKGRVTHGELIFCSTPADYLIPAGISNWGAFALVATLSLLVGRLLLRSPEHEYAVLTDPLIVELGLGAWGYGLSSLELTSFELYGHFGVIPLTPTAGVNGGTEPWQTYPSATDPDRKSTRLNSSHQI